jgi:hypothetical protein
VSRAELCRRTHGSCAVVVTWSCRAGPHATRASALVKLRDSHRSHGKQEASVTTERGLTALPTVPTSVRSTNSAWDGIVHKTARQVQAEHAKSTREGLERT